jgi:hypothetical protein
MSAARSSTPILADRRKSALFPCCRRIATFFVSSFDATLPLLSCNTRARRFSFPTIPTRRTVSVTNVTSFVFIFFMSDICNADTFDRVLRRRNWRSGGTATRCRGLALGSRAALSSRHPNSGWFSHIQRFFPLTSGGDRFDARQPTHWRNVEELLCHSLREGWQAEVGGSPIVATALVAEVGDWKTSRRAAALLRGSDWCRDRIRRGANRDSAASPSKAIDICAGCSSPAQASSHGRG